MKNILAILFTLLVLQLCAQNPAEHTLTITAEGTTEVIPDLIRCSLNLYGNVFGKDAQDVTVKICDKALEDLGVKGSAYFEMAENYSAGTGYEYTYTYDQQNPFPFNRTYVVVFSKMEDYTRLTEACSKYHTNGVTATATLTYVGLSQTNAESIHLAAFRKAIEQAKTKAGIVTQVLGAQLGEVISVTENPGETYIDFTSMYYNYYVPGKPLKIPFTSYANVQFRLK